MRYLRALLYIGTELFSGLLHNSISVKKTYFILFQNLSSNTKSNLNIYITSLVKRLCLRSKVNCIILTKFKSQLIHVKTKSFLKTHRKAKDKSFSNFKYNFSHPVIFYSFYVKEENLYKCKT